MMEPVKPAAMGAEPEQRIFTSTVVVSGSLATAVTASCAQTVKTEKR